MGVIPGLGRSEAKAESPESILPVLWLWIPGSPLRFAARRPGMTER